MDEAIPPDQRHPARYWHRLDDGRLQCDLCPRDCVLQEGQRGFCFVRGRVEDRMVLTTWGRSSGFCIDPIEKKPLNHFLPGSGVLSFGTAGYNLACRFCQNWDLSRSRDMDHLQVRALPEDIARAARTLDCPSVAFTYNDPVIFFEYALDTAAACHALGLNTVAVTAGYLHAAPRLEFFRQMDAANVDLKAFDEGFYRKLTGSHLQPVLDTLTEIHRNTDCWLEITTLLIPGENDSDVEITQLSEWIASTLGPEVPLHFSAFHPTWKMQDTPPTPAATLRRARARSLATGLRHVYTGNVHDPAGGTTHCAGCGTSLIVRDWYDITHYALDAGGHCPTCGRTLAGRFTAFSHPFGARRIPVDLARLTGRTP